MGEFAHPFRQVHALGAARSPFCKWLRDSQTAILREKVQSCPRHSSSIAAKCLLFCAQVYADINNGAYKAGFSGSQAAYEVAFERFFAALDRAEAMLQKTRC